MRLLLLSPDLLSRINHVHIHDNRPRARYMPRLDLARSRGEARSGS